MSPIVWLVSYPKSGNTWLRAFLTNFHNDGDSPVDINHLSIKGISSDRYAADEALGVECSDLSPEEIDRYRPAVYRDLARRSDKALFIKTHEAYTLNAKAEPLLPADVTRGAIYIVRNPLDVSISYAHHVTETFDDAINRLARETAALDARPDRLSVHLHQRLLSWSRHVSSWLDQGAIQVHLMRYEDMCRQPVEVFADAIRFLGFQCDLERVRRAVAFSCFEALRQQERERGFKEKPLEAHLFFRSGRVGQWRELLTKQQVERVIRDHGPVMQRVGYGTEYELLH